MRKLAAGAAGAVVFLTFLHGVTAQPRRIGPARARPVTAARGGPAAPGGPQRVDANGNAVVDPGTPREAQQCITRCDDLYERCANRCAANSSRCVRGCITAQFECRMRCPAQDGGIAGIPTAGLERFAPH